MLTLLDVVTLLLCLGHAPRYKVVMSDLSDPPVVNAMNS